MENVIVEESSDATGLIVDAALRVGRGADNDVVLDHPTVSRHHAVIERVGNDYFLRDLGSRNATRLNGRTLRARRPLKPGDRIRFGQVRVTFTLGADPAANPSLDQSAGAAVPAGIVFNCPCGVRLWAKREAATGLVTCRKCHAKVHVPEESTNADSGETVSGIAFSAPPETLSAPVQTGSCSICQWPTRTDEQITSCPACGLMFHVECWTENCGCSAYGCPQVNALTLVGRRSEVASRESEVSAGFNALPPKTHDRLGMPFHPPPTSYDPPSSESLPVGHVMLAASVVGSVLGLLMFGALPLIVLVASLTTLLKRRRTRNRKLLLLAAGVSVFGAIVGVAVSSMLWLRWSTGGAGGTS